MYYLGHLEINNPNPIINDKIGKFYGTDASMANLQTPNYGYSRTWGSASPLNKLESIVSCDASAFVVNIDVTYFHPKNIFVGVKENEIKVEYKHDEKEDEQGGTVSRHFIRKYQLTSGAYKMDCLNCVLSSDGVLTITVPSNKEEDKGFRVIPIDQTGVPSAPNIHNNKNKEDIDRKFEDPKTEELKVSEVPPQAEVSELENPENGETKSTKDNITNGKSNLKDPKPEDIDRKLEDPKPEEPKVPEVPPQEEVSKLEDPENRRTKSADGTSKLQNPKREDTDRKLEDPKARRTKSALDTPTSGKAKWKNQKSKK